ncbi:MAG: hypothetical protein ACP5FZ_08740 [Fidelibacterota bacterium]
MKNIKMQIQKGLDKGKKTFQFDNEHDQTKPAEWWFQNIPEGLVLFVVFYTQACRWGRCLGCNLPSKSAADHVDYKAIVSQIDYLFDLKIIQKKRFQIRKVIVSNNGSVLDEDTFSSTALMYLMVKLNLTFPHLSTLCIETRPEYVEVEELEFLRRSLNEGDTPTKLELAIGFEVFDNRIRNKIFMKGLSLNTFEKFVEKVAPYKYDIKCYFMQKPVPGMTDKEAISDVKSGIDYFSRLAEYHDININMHLNPTFVAKGTALAEAFYQGEYKPPALMDVVISALYAEKKRLSLFIGLSDEGLAVEHGSHINDANLEMIDKIEQFNRTQSYELLHEVLMENLVPSELYCS